MKIFKSLLNSIGPFGFVFVAAALISTSPAHAGYSHYEKMAYTDNLPVWQARTRYHCYFSMFCENHKLWK